MENTRERTREDIYARATTVFTCLLECSAVNLSCGRMIWKITMGWTKASLFMQVCMCVWGRGRIQGLRMCRDILRVLAEGTILIYILRSKVKCYAIVFCSCGWRHSSTLGDLGTNYSLYLHVHYEFTHTTACWCLSIGQHNHSIIKKKGEKLISYIYCLFWFYFLGSTAPGWLFWQLWQLVILTAF